MKSDIVPETSAPFAEPARTLPLDDWADVIVAGGGPAGVSAAVSSSVASAVAEVAR